MYRTSCTCIHTPSFQKHAFMYMYMYTCVCALSNNVLECWLSSGTTAILLNSFVLSVSPYNETLSSCAIIVQPQQPNYQEIVHEQSSPLNDDSRYVYMYMNVYMYMYMYMYT